jgi:hypothetical protein
MRQYVQEFKKFARGVGTADISVDPVPLLLSHSPRSFPHLSLSTFCTSCESYF